MFVQKEGREGGREGGRREGARRTAADSQSTGISYCVFDLTEKKQLFRLSLGWA